MVNIVTPEHNPFLIDENEEYEWNDEMLNNVGILELDMDIDWNTTFDDNPDLEPVTMDMDMDNNNATWDDDYIPEPPVLIRQNAMEPVVIEQQRTHCTNFTFCECDSLHYPTHPYNNMLCFCPKTKTRNNKMENSHKKPLF